MKIKPLGKLIIFLLVVCAAYGGYRFYEKKTQNAPAAGGEGYTKIEGDQGVLGRPLVVALNEWPGFVGGLFANNGLKPNHDCIFYKKGNLLVEFRIMLDPAAMAQAFEAGQVDVMWQTIDTVPTVNYGLKKNKKDSVVFMQCDWSRGGDAILAVRGINSIEDLAGKKVGLITLSPSDFLLRYGLRNSSLSEVQQQGVVERMQNMSDPDALQKAILTGAVPAIVTWEPAVSDTLAKGRSKGVHVILSTETIANAIADVFMAKKDLVEKHPEAIKAFIDGWFEGTNQANRDRSKAIKVVMDNMDSFKSLGPDKTADTFAKVKLADMSDNAKTFALGGGEPVYDTIYNDALAVYSARGVLEGKVDVGESKDVTQLKKLFESVKPEERNVAPKEEFTFSEKQKEKATSKAPVMTKPVTINFDTGSAALDPNAKNVLQSVVNLLKVSSNAFIRIEGNTDSVGGAAANVALSERRAQAVRDYLVAQGYSASRFIVKGNGPNKPVASNATEAGRSKNRRTDIQVIPK